MKRPINIGYANPGYPVIRTILDKCKGLTYTRVRPYSSICSNVASKIHLNKLASDFVYMYFGGLNARGVDLLHFFNTIPLTNVKKPFITTFETTVPRFFMKGSLYQNALKNIASKRCKKLLALSECAKNLQARMFALEGVELLAKKIEVLHPPQETLVSIEKVVNKDFSKREIVFIFVGRAFWCKGGSHCIRVLEKIRKNYNIRLQVVGDIASLDYMSHPKRDNCEEILKIINNNDWIEYYPSLPNSAVLSLIKKADIGLLPTRADTYGYSVLEMQAAGLPCITTDLRALPEINNMSCGWLIEIPKDENCNAKFSSHEEKDLLCETIESKLEKICESIVSRPEMIKEKALNSFERIKTCHNPIDYGENLLRVYHESLV